MRNDSQCSCIYPSFGIYCVTEMMWNCLTSGVLYVSRREQGWRDGDNKRVEHCWYGRTHVGVLYICKLLKNPLVAKRRIILCQNDNFHYYLLFSSSGQTANQSNVRNHLNSLLQFVSHTHSIVYTFLNFLSYSQVDGGLKADMSPDDSDLEARLNSWNLGVSPEACLELLG